MLPSWCSRSERCAIDVDYWLLSHVEPCNVMTDCLVCFRTFVFNALQFFQNRFKRSFSWLGRSINRKAIYLKQFKGSVSNNKVITSDLIFNKTNQSDLLKNMGRFYLSEVRSSVNFPFVFQYMHFIKMVNLQEIIC